MKVAVTGSRGFLGSKFIELYSKNYSELIALDRNNAPLNNLFALKEKTEGVEVLVHCAFDHQYKDNLIGIRNLLKVCKLNKIKRLIHLSTYSVYDPNFMGILNEESPYSSINDPYSKEKRKIEEEIEKHKYSEFDILILQPTVIYGLGGNWTKFAFHVCKSKEVSLANSGERICNSVYVNDVAEAIYKGSFSNSHFKKIIISGKDQMTWKEFYEGHCQILKELGQPFNCNITKTQTRNDFHSNSFLNLLLKIWFETRFGFFFDFMVGTAKKIRSKKYNRMNNMEEIKEFLISETLDNKMEPVGITKKIHDCEFFAEIRNARDLLGYEPRFDFQSGINEMYKKLREF